MGGLPGQAVILGDFHNRNFQDIISAYNGIPFINVSKARFRVGSVRGTPVGELFGQTVKSFQDIIFCVNTLLKKSHRMVEVSGQHCPQDCNK